MNGPKAITTRRSEYSLDMLLKIGFDAVVIQEGVIDIDQENNGTDLFHIAVSRIRFLTFNSVIRPEENVSSRSRSKNTGFILPSVHPQRQFPAATPGTFILPSTPRFSRSCSGAMARPAFD